MEENNNRVIFFSDNDLSISHYYDRIKTIINDYPIEYNNISEIIELYQVKKFIDSDFFNNIIDDKFQLKCGTLRNEAFPLIYNFFDSIKNKLLDNYIIISPYQYKKSFWEIIEKINFYKNIDEEQFQELSNITPLNILLKFPNMVSFFNKILKERILADDNAVVLILENYIIDSILYTQEKYNLPKLSNIEINKIFEKYINTLNPNPNYLDAIELFDKKMLDPKIKLEARKQSLKIKEIFFKDKNQDELFIEDIKINIDNFEIEKEQRSNFSKGYECIFNYDKRKLFSDLSTIAIINKFIYIFDFVDYKQKRLLLINIDAYKSLFERLIFTKYKISFNPGLYFKSSLKIKVMQLTSYYNILKDKYNTELEIIIKNYFEKYILQQYGVNGFKISMPSSDLNWLEKCKILCTTIDSILKQFILFVNYGSINLELLDFTSPVSYNNIPSLLDKKYYYGNEPYVNKLFYYLFSDQCMLSYIKRIADKSKSYRNFYELVKNENIQIVDYDSIYVENIKFLQEHHFIKINDDGYLYPTPFADIYQNLFLYGVINYLNSNNSWKNEIAKMEEAKYIFNENKLLSRCESDTFNYLLNNKTFKDSLAIRNKYIHGDMDRFPENDSIHETNYYLIFVVLISFVIKIDDELENYYK
jgi:hypothetical protein